MRITRLEPIVLGIGAVDTGRADGTQDAFLVRVHTDEGIVGVGEADTSPYLARTMIEMPSSHVVARGLADLLVGEDPLEVERLWRLMWQGSSYYGRSGLALQVMSAVDMALWDIAGKASGQPVVELLGGATVSELRVYASQVMPETAAEVRDIAERAVADGYTALKLGWGPLGSDLGRDEALARSAREVLGPDRELMLDGGHAYTVERAVELVERLDDVGLYWLEEPFAPDDYESYRRLADSVSVRLAAGEADSDIKPFRALVEDGRLNVLQPDMGRCGGFTVARQIAALEQESAIEIVPHCFSTGVLIAASLHFAASLGRPTFSEYSVADSPLVNGILTEPFSLRAGKLAVPTGAGLGVELDEEAVARLRID
jgi:L-alanine-DL-glutamate epimerase-like enolase superfamily enzyme